MCVLPSLSQSSEIVSESYWPWSLLRSRDLRGCGFLCPWYSVPSHILKSSRTSTGQASSCFTFLLVLSGSTNHTREKSDLYSAFSHSNPRHNHSYLCVSYESSQGLPCLESFFVLFFPQPGMRFPWLFMCLSATPYLGVICCMYLCVVTCTCCRYFYVHSIRNGLQMEYTRPSYHWHAPPHHYKSSSAWSEFGQLLIRCVLAYGLSPLKNRTRKKIQTSPSSHFLVCTS